MSDLTEQLRAGARREHDDLSVMAEAADHIEELEAALAKAESERDEAREQLRYANAGSLPLLYDIRRELGWNDKTSLSILADGVRRVRRALQTWDTPTGMDLEALALSIKARIVDLEKANIDNKTRINELLEELAKTTEEEEDDHL